MFRNNTASANGDGMTHFGHAMESLNFEIFCANSPQVKGRVERANGTFQDRLVKEMRLGGVSTIAQANVLLLGYMARHNGRFAKVPGDARGLHRPFALPEDLKAEVVWREQRTVNQALALATLSASELWLTSANIILFLTRSWCNGRAPVSLRPPEMPRWTGPTS